MGRLKRLCFLAATAWFAAAGCHHPSITAVSLNPSVCTSGCNPIFHHHPKEPQGIPFYLPKPLLIVAKNFRNIEEAKVGLTDSAPIPNYFDDQAKYADLNARTNFVMPDGASGNVSSTNTTTNTTTFPANAENLSSVSEAKIYSPNGAPMSPGAAPADGLSPATFYTYHVVFVPDLTQKYGLKIKGGVGEIRAAMNLVNGWQFTGLGPYYMKDSSTAQNTLAAGITANLAGSGVANVLKAAANLRPGVSGGGQRQSGVPQQPVTVDDVEKIRALTDAMKELKPKHITIPAYAEISIYEPYLTPDGMMEWKPILERAYSRDIITTDATTPEVKAILGKALGLDFTEAAPPPATSRGPFVAPPNPGFAPSPSVGTPPSTLTPAIPAPGGSGAPQLEIPSEASRTSGRRGTELAAQASPKWDAGLVRAQQGGVVPNAAGSPASVILPPVAAGSPVKMKLSRAPGLGARSDQVTTDPNPTIEVRSLPENTNIQLFRDNQPLYMARTGPGISDLLLRDNQSGPVGAGRHDYVVATVDAANQVVPVGKLTVHVVPAPTQEVVDLPAETGTAAATVDPALIRQMFAQVGALPPQPDARMTVAPPQSGKQINLNQYFGKAKHQAAAGEPAKPFKLFHHKEKARPEIRTAELSGLAGLGTAQPDMAFAGSPNIPIQNTNATVKPSTQPIPDTDSFPTPPSTGETPIPGTGAP